MQVAVEREVEFSLALSPERGIPVPALLSYRLDDPYAVHFTFHLGSEAPVEWSFARDLLAEGLCRPCGPGDVRLWPTTVGGRAVLHLALASLDGEALLTAPAEAVRAWLRMTQRLVTPGAESVAAALEEELEELLASAAATGEVRAPRRPSRREAGEAPASRPRAGERASRDRPDSRTPTGDVPPLEER